MGHSDTDSTNSDEELDGDEEEDMVNYVKNKIAERRAIEPAVIPSYRAAELST